MKRAAVIGIVAASALIIGGVGAAWLLLSRQPTAEDAARTYLTALSRGDLDTIQSMRDDRLGGDAEEILAAAFADAAFVQETRIEDLAARPGGGVEVRATAALDGERVDLSFELAQEGDRGWVLRGEYLASATVDAALDGGRALPAVWIGDALAPTGAPVALLPAAYVVDAAPRGIVEGTAALPLGTSEPVTVELRAALTPEALARAQEQIDAYARTCAEPATAVADNCGMVVPWAADLAELDRLAFRIDQLPTVTLSPDGASFDATGGVIVATATGVTHQGTPGTFTYRADDWALRGTMRLSDEEMLLAVH